MPIIAHWKRRWLSNSFHYKKVFFKFLSVNPKRVSNIINTKMKQWFLKNMLKEKLNLPSSIQSHWAKQQEIWREIQILKLEIVKSEGR